MILISASKQLQYETTVRHNVVIAANFTHASNASPLA